MDILHKLPTDLQETVYDMYCNKFYEKTYVVECLLGIETVTNWQGTSAWHNDDPGDDDFDYYQVPLFQLVYNDWTKEWYQPGKVCSINLPDHYGYMIDDDIWDSYFMGFYYDKAQLTNVGESKIHFNKVESMMKRKIVNSPKYRKLVDTINRHNEVGNYREFHKIQTHKYITSWYTSHRLIFRVREIVDSPPPKKDKWTKSFPDQWNIDIVSDFTPYDFHTKHLYSNNIIEDTVVYFWKDFLNILKNNSMEDTLKNIDDSITKASAHYNQKCTNIYKLKLKNIYNILDT